MVNETGNESLFSALRAAAANLLKSAEQRDPAVPGMRDVVRGAANEFSIGEVLSDIRNRTSSMIEPGARQKAQEAAQEFKPNKVDAGMEIAQETLGKVFNNKGITGIIANNSPIAASALGATGALMGFQMVSKVVSGGTLGKKEAIQAGLGLLIGGVGLGLSGSAAKTWVNKVGGVHADLQTSFKGKLEAQQKAAQQNPQPGIQL